MTTKQKGYHTDRTPIISAFEGQAICDEIFAWLESGTPDEECCRRMAELLRDVGYPIAPSNWPPIR